MSALQPRGHDSPVIISAEAGLHDLLLLKQLVRDNISLIHLIRSLPWKDVSGAAGAALLAVGFGMRFGVDISLIILGSILFLIAVKKS